MKYILFILSTTILFSCGSGGGGIDISSIKDQFPRENQQKISFQYSSDPVFDNWELAKQLLKIADPNTEYGDDYKDLNLKLQSWYDLDRIKGFTISKEDGCDNGVYFFGLNEGGKVVSAEKVALVADCGDIGSTTISEVAGDSAIIAISRTGSFSHAMEQIIQTTYTMQTDGTIAGTDMELNQSVCLWEKLTIKEGPSEKAKYKTSITLGEEILELGQKQVDSESENGHTYSLVRLSDGTEGWVQERFLGVNNGAAAVTTRTRLFERADELTGTEVYFEVGDIIGAGERKGEPFDNGWYKVKGVPSGENWFKDGWIKEDDISFWNKEVTLGSLLKSALKSENGEDLVKLINDPQWEGTRLIAKAKKMAGVSKELSPELEQLLNRFEDWTFPVNLVSRHEDGDEIEPEVGENWFSISMNLTTVGKVKIEDYFLVMVNQWFMGNVVVYGYLINLNGEVIDDIQLYTYDGLEGMGTLEKRSRIKSNGDILIETKRESDMEEEESLYSVETYKLTDTGFQGLVATEVLSEELTLWEDQ